MGLETGNTAQPLKYHDRPQLGSDLWIYHLFFI